MGRSATIVVVLCAALAVAARADAQYFGRNKVYYDRLEFRMLQTEHFDIYYYAEEEAATREAARLAERWYARLTRLFDHRFAHRQPIVLYASHPDFQQTNLTAGSPGEGTGGFTERNKSRIAMPFAAGLGETDHVLGHEIVHAFQIDIAKSVRRDAFTLPGWVIEGMAEYVSLGPTSVHTDMWIRDAAAHDRLPTLAQLNDPRYFPYRFGHAFWSYLGARFGDRILGDVLRSKVRGLQPRLQAVTGITPEQLTTDWHATVAAAAAENPSCTCGAPLVDDGGRIHVGPALSPDGTRVMFLSERDRLSMDLFMADVDSGRVLAKIVSTATDPHFDSLQYIYSSGAWDPAGRRFALTALTAGEPVLVLIDVDGSMRRQEIPLRGVGEVYTPSWSPDGSQIVFSGLKGGVSDLFVLTLATGELRQLTADLHADLQPAWSPDGRHIAFATDRFTSTIDTLRFGALRIGIIDLDTGLVRALPSDGGATAAGAHVATAAKQINPQWSPDGATIYYVSDRTGISNVYRQAIAGGAARQITAVPSGVSGITAASPSLSVAATRGTLAFTVYRGGRYEIRTFAPDAAAAQADRDTPAIDAGLFAIADALAESPALPSARQTPAPLVAGTLATGEAVAAPAVATPGDTSPTVAALLADASTGLPDADAFTTANYNDRLRLESVSQPYIGAANGNGFGGVLRTTIGFTFGDMLRDRQLSTALRLGTDVDDIAMQVAYVNRKSPMNWGVVAGFLPSHFYGARRSLERDGDLVTRETSHLRYLHQWVGLTGHYSLSRVKRIELGAGVRRTGLEWQTVTRVTNSSENRVVSRELAETSAGQALYLGEVQAAFVHDTSVQGPLGPVLGQRVRLEVQPSFGAITFADVRVDARRYFMPVRPVTIAARVEHVGRYGRNASDPRLMPLVAGLQTMVRGYDLRNFAVDECGLTAVSCSVVDELTGSRLALVNLEVRAPIPGLFSRELRYSGLPVEAIAFVDTGYLWTRGIGGADRDTFRSAGAGARANLGGIVLEVTAARPFDSPTRGWTTSVLLRPGW